jgi:hypothetical protein
MLSKIVLSNTTFVSSSRTIGMMMTIQRPHILFKHMIRQPCYYSKSSIVSSSYPSTIINNHTASSSTSPTSATWLYNSLSFAAPEESEQSYIQSMLPTHYNINHTYDFNYMSSSISPLSSTTTNSIRIPIRTLQDAITNTNYACIVTTITSPHTIVAVNDVWTQLCGYEQSEIHHQSISNILHGPLTNTETIQNTLKRVDENIIHANRIDASNNNNNKTDITDNDKTEDMYVINYKKDGTSFINHVTISKIILSDDEPNEQYLLGIVQPVVHVPLRMVL